MSIRDYDCDVCACDLNDTEDEAVVLCRDCADAGVANWQSEVDSLRAQVEALEERLVEALRRVALAERREDAHICQTDQWFANLASILGARSNDIDDIMKAAKAAVHN